MSMFLYETTSPKSFDKRLEHDRMSTTGWLVVVVRGGGSGGGGDKGIFPVWKYKNVQELGKVAKQRP